MRFSEVSLAFADVRWRSPTSAEALRVAEGRYVSPSFAEVAKVRRCSPRFAKVRSGSPMLAKIRLAEVLGSLRFAEG